MRGSVRKRSRGTWTLTFDIAPHADGRRRQRRETIHGTREEAEKRLAARITEIATGVYSESGSDTFADLSEHYLTAKALRVEATTVALSRRILRQHVLPAIGHVRLEALRPTHVQSAIDALSNQSRTKAKGNALGPQTARNVLILIRATLAWGVKMDLLPRNVAKVVEPPRALHKEMRALEPAALRGLLAVAAGTDLEAIIITAIGTGMRRAELVALRWSDVDLNTGRYSIRRSAKVVGHEVVVGTTKTRGSTRSDVLPAFVIDALRRYRTDQRKRHLALGVGNLGPDAYVFDRFDGTIWHPNHVSQRFSRLVRRAKLPTMRFHDLRHGFASLAFAAGVPLKVVSEALGHSGIAITSQTYVHLLDDLKRDKSDRLDAYLDGVFDVPPASGSEAS
jgi:integrase